MQIQGTSGFTHWTVSSFEGATWKGKAVQILCVVAFLSLIYYVAFRSKKDKSEDKSNLAGRVQSEPPPQAQPAPQIPEGSQRNLDVGIFRETEQQKELGYRIRIEVFNFWLLAKMQDYGTWKKMAFGSELDQKSCRAVLRDLAQEMKTQLLIMIPIFQAHPEVKRGNWYLFLKNCKTFSDGRMLLPESCKKAYRCLKMLHIWNKRLQKFRLQRIKGHPDIWDLCDFGQILNLQMRTCKQWSVSPIISQQHRYHQQVVKTCIPLLKDLIKKLIPAFKVHAEIRTEEWTHFLSECDAIATLQPNPQICSQKLKTLLTQIQSCHVKLFDGYGIKEYSKGPIFLKAFLKDLKLWLPEKIESCNYMILTSNKGSKLDQAISSQAFIVFVLNLKSQVGKICLFLKDYPACKIQDWTKLQIMYDHYTDGSWVDDLGMECNRLKGCFEDLQRWAADLEKQLSDQ